MLVSHSHRFIFVHIQKTAGQSLKRVLAPYCGQPPRTGWRRVLSHLPVPENPAKVALRVHATARWARMKLSAELFDSYCRFAVVRNPFDRAVSNYHFVRQSPRHHASRYLRELTFDGYLDFLARRRWASDPTQKARLVDGRANLLCDSILRFETLSGDFAALCARLGIAAVELPRNNTSKHAPWPEYYQSRATRDRAVDLYAADFAAFGYATEI